jgi:uncharacterized membrane protein YbhN (UPF0104 family)
MRGMLPFRPVLVGIPRLRARRRDRVLNQLLHAANAFTDHLRAIVWSALAVAVGLHVTKMLVRTRAWRNILAAANPQARVHWRHVFGAYVAGAAVNAVLPARGGDVLKLYLIKRRIAESRYPTLTATLAVDTLFDFVVSSLLLVWALGLNVLPGLDVLGRIRSIDWSWAERNPRLALGIVAAVLVAVLVGALLARHRVRELAAALRRGGAILSPPSQYLKRVVAWQVLDWILRLGTIFFMLRAFGVPATVHNALLVQVTQSLSTLVPLTPGGIGTEQGLIVYVFAGKANAAAVLSFSVGMKATLIAVNVLVGFAAIAIMLRTLRWKRVLARRASGVPDQ